MITVPRLLSLLPIVVAVMGCSKGGSLKTVPVTGKVTLNGQPLSGAAITFVPAAPAADGTSSVPSSGITGADGSYKLITMATGREVVDGVPPGNYKVMVTKQSSSPPITQSTGLMTNDPEYAKKMASMSNEERNAMRGGNPPGEQPRAAAKSEVPRRYSNADTSGLAATVGASGSQTFDFPLSAE